jgi:membrane protease subunit (stomatin/prohibitin family)
VVAGTATAVSNRVSRRQANRWSQQDEQAYNEQQQQQQSAQPQYAEPPPPPAPDPIAQLKELAELKDQGILTEAEFAAQKAKILGS